MHPCFQRCAMIIDLVSPGVENELLAPACHVKAPSATAVSHHEMFNGHLCLLHCIFLIGLLVK